MIRGARVYVAVAGIDAFTELRWIISRAEAAQSVQPTLGVPKHARHRPEDTLVDAAADLV
jgi:hypothetical protein